MTSRPQPPGEPGSPPATSPVRVALLAPSLHPGGAERQMLILAATLPRGQFDLRFVVLSEPGALAEEARAIGVPVHVVGLRRDACRRLSPACLLAIPRALRAYRRLTRDVDIVDAWLVPAYTFAGLARPLGRRPLLLAGRRSSLDVRRTRTWYRLLAERLAMRRVAAVVANSQAAADEAIAIERIPRRRVHVIRNAVVPVPTPPAARSRLRRTWGFGDDDLVAGVVGTLKPGKGHDLLLDVAAALRGRCPLLRLCFVGDGPLREDLATEIRRRGLERIVVLHVGEADARGLYGAFDLAIQASSSEGLPNAVLEAAAAGLPIVATSVGGTPEILTDGEDGVLVARGSRAGLQAAIEMLVGDPALRARLGRAARERSADFSADRLAGETGALYLRLAGRDSGSAGPDEAPAMRRDRSASNAP